MKILWGRVLIAAVAVGLGIAAVRGCAMARRGGGSVTPVQTELSICVFDTRQDRSMEMPLEDYLVGVVAGEMPATFPAEALKAQAVAARSYTVYHMLHGGCAQHDADVCTSSACCQAHADETRLQERWGKAYKKNVAVMSAAVKDTAGQVLLYDGEPIEALYHSSSGGGTENAEDVYKNTVPYLRGVESSAEVGSSRLTGEKRFQTGELIALVNEKWPDAALKATTLSEQIEIRETTKSGRVKSIRLGKTEVTGRQLRGVLKLDSALFTMDFGQDSVTFYTKGYGHGVGMSQTGACAMALGGRSYEEILLYYYSDVSLGAIAP